MLIYFIQNDFVDSYYPTIESTYTKNMVYNGVEYECEIIDTPGQARPLFPLLGNVSRPLSNSFRLLNLTIVTFFLKKK